MIKSLELKRRAKGILQRIWQFHAMFVRHPVLALLCIPLYLAAAAIVTANLVVFLYVADSSFGREHFSIILLWFLVSLSTLIVIGADLLTIQFLAVAGGIRFGPNRHELVRIAQAILVTVLVFAVTYYYLQLFSANKAFNNMTPIVVDPNGPLTNAGFVYQAICQVPPTETIIDCLYFSVITITTVGYGDIHPATSYAKLVCIVEIILGYMLLVLSIGAIASTPKKSGEVSPSQPKSSQSESESSPSSIPATGGSLS